MPLIALPTSGGSGSVSACVENLTIDGISLTTPAWWCGDLAPLVDGPDLRGEDTLLPGVAGVVANPRRVTVSKRSVQMFITGDYDRLGVAQTNPRIGLQRNCQYLIDNLLIPPGGDGTRLAVLTMADETTRSARVHVLPPLELSAAGHRGRRGVLTLSIPGGYFKP